MPEGLTGLLESKDVSNLTLAERRLIEWIRWYEYHKDDASDIDQKIKFYRKCIEGCFEIMYHLTTMIRESEGRDRLIVRAR